MTRSIFLGVASFAMTVLMILSQGAATGANMIS
ncbi:hypothetical protein ACVWZA_000293 [Sphingomonas sp. UYAg733]